MALLTVTEVKAILNITANTWNEQLKVLLPIIQDQVVFSLTQNTFSHPKIRMVSSTLTFDNGDKTIVDSESQFLENNLIAKQDILVSGSLHNDGLWEIKTVEAGTIIVDFRNLGNKALVDEAEGEVVTVFPVVFPQNLKLTTSKLVNYLIQKDNLKGIKSESVVSYSVSYMNDIPSDIKSEFASYKKLTW